MKGRRKGEWGYFDSERKRKLLITAASFLIPAVILISGALYFGTKANLMTVVAMVGMIPASMSLVSTIMFFLRHSLPEEEYRAIEPHEGSLTVAYELYLTSEKQNALVDCIAICGTELVGYISDSGTDPRFAEDHLTRMLRADGYRMNVRMLTDLRRFTERMDSMNEHAESLRKDLKFTPNSAYEGYGREDMIRHCALNLSI